MLSYDEYSSMIRSLVKYSVKYLLAIMHSDNKVEFLTFVWKTDLVMYAKKKSRRKLCDNGKSLQIIAETITLS